MFWLPQEKFSKFLPQVKFSLLFSLKNSILLNIDRKASLFKRILIKLIKANKIIVKHWQKKKAFFQLDIATSWVHPVLNKLVLTQLPKVRLTEEKHCCSEKHRCLKQQFVKKWKSSLFNISSIVCKFCLTIVFSIQI